MVPTALNLSQDIYRIYFSGRDDNNHSHIGFFDLDLNEPTKILRISDKPVLSPGQLGCFDDCGVTPSWALKNAGVISLYFIGWNKRSSVRMGLIAGLAISHDNGESFKRFSRAPILERTDIEPYNLMTAPCVIKEEDIWKMWYVSGVNWIHPDLPKYNIKYAESDDGKIWRRDGLTCIDFDNEHEYAIARPCVLKEGNLYKMWFSAKGNSNKGGFYSIGYAESADGKKWDRMDSRVDLTVSKKGWDSEMIEYTYVIPFKNKYYLFYNGNNYGENGIGLAISEK